MQCSVGCWRSIVSQCDSCEDTPILWLSDDEAEPFAHSVMPTTLCEAAVSDISTKLVGQL